jgi:hypothetical protein
MIIHVESPNYHPESSGGACAIITVAEQAMVVLLIQQFSITVARLLTRESVMTPDSPVHAATTPDDGMALRSQGSLPVIGPREVVHVMHMIDW